MSFVFSNLAKKYRCIVGSYLSDNGDLKTGIVRYTTVEQIEGLSYKPKVKPALS